MLMAKTDTVLTVSTLNGASLYGILLFHTAIGWETEPIGPGGLLNF